MDIDYREFEGYVNKQIVVLLKDYTFLYGTLKSYDQFNNLSLNFTTARIFHNDSYAEQKVGLIAVRGDCVISIAFAEHNLKGLKEMDYEELFKQKYEYQQRKSQKLI